MPTTIRCPHCAQAFELTEVMRTQLEHELREDLQREHAQHLLEERQRAEAEAAVTLRARDQALQAARTQLAQAGEREQQLLHRQQQLEDHARQADLDLERRLDEERRHLREAAEKEAEERHARRAAEATRAIEGELVALRTKLAEADEKERGFLKRRQEVEDRARCLELDLERRLSEERGRIHDAAAQEAEQRHALRAAEAIREKDRELEEARAKLGEATLREAELLRRRRELDEREQALPLELERRLLESEQVLSAKHEQQAAERAVLERTQRELSEQEHRLQIEGLRKNITELQERLEQKSQQAVGEAQEVVLKGLLAQAFADDAIEDVAKGERGADLVQRVKSGEGRDAGAILWESKRTRNWSDGWLAKLRDDQREIGADCAILVSQVLPKGMAYYELRDGVWICSWPLAVPLGAVIRAGLVEVFQARSASLGRTEKMSLLYEYLTGTEFRNRLGGMVEAFLEMEDDLLKERRAMYAQFKKRERQLERARVNISAFYGDLRGIAGRQIQELPGLEMPAALPDAAGAEEAQGEGGEARGVPVRTAGGALVELMYQLVPASGEAIGNVTLRAQFEEQAAAKLGVAVGDDEFEQCRSALLDQRRIRKGKGRGGSVLRVQEAEVRVEGEGEET